MVDPNTIKPGLYWCRELVKLSPHTPHETRFCLVRISGQAPFLQAEACTVDPPREWESFRPKRFAELIPIEQPPPLQS